MLALPAENPAVPEVVHVVPLPLYFITTDLLLDTSIKDTYGLPLKSTAIVVLVADPEEIPVPRDVHDPPLYFATLTLFVVPST